MNGSKIGLVLGLVGVCALSGGATAAPLPEGETASVAAQNAASSERDVEIYGYEVKLSVGVRGRFEFDATCHNEGIAIEATIEAADSKRSVPVEVKRDKNAMFFSVDIKGRDHKLPKGFKGRALVHLTSNCKGSWSQVEVYAKN